MFWRRKKKTEDRVSSDSWLIVGLGNPGAKYEATRHNVGQMVVDVLAARVGAKFSPHRSNARIAEGRISPGGPKLILAKSNGYMNTSGGPVSALARYFEIPAERIIVIHDELDLPFDTIKLKQGGGHGGHNGLRDIAKALDTPEFLRVRVGIGRPPGQQDPADYVLRPFGSSERANLGVLLEDAADAAEVLTTAGLTAAQQTFHGRASQ
ncbi:aminoacyl-tRNA hydrolase [Leucobacter insecticola]|uniref:Peptidyl-tRNA hydrolase n=1 Tax=Leucobacter insecticola TaxID=2714934 RepID=A0A6G8FKZ5_9MICO|nr:aminoacyl-tRNA hydrolase [Leucobacter insecticola]QIM17024.1 aminoacyl-tRNA hydrolase [Leucobacter insecticola]